MDCNTLKCISPGQERTCPQLFIGQAFYISSWNEYFLHPIMWSIWKWFYKRWAVCVNETRVLHHSSQLYEPQKPFRPHLWLPLFFYKRHSSTCISNPYTIYQWRRPHPHRERERDGWMGNAGPNETKARLLLLNCSAFTTVCGFNYAETQGGEEMPHRAKDRHWEN